MHNQLHDLIDDYMLHYDTDVTGAILIMKEDLDTALIDRQRDAGEGEQP